MLILYFLTLAGLAIFSWGFVDVNFPFQTLPILRELVWAHRGATTIIYSIIFTVLFIWYIWALRMVRRNKFTVRSVVLLICGTVITLYFSFPAFAYDIFNYIASARITFLYKENPYVVMPIEIPNEPMLAFMHAANKVALYGFVWIALTGIPFILGMGNLVCSVFTFKGSIVLFYIALSWLIWKLSQKSLTALAFFALNPLVIIETLVSAHNDVVMMALALFSYYFFKKGKLSLSVGFLILSIFIKFATIALIPIFIFLFYKRYKQNKIYWASIWKWSAIAMFAMFLLSPFREEIYSWYIIWPLTFVALMPKTNVLTLIVLGFSFGLPFRIAPYLYTREWGGVTPIIKKIVTFVPPFIATVYYAFKKKI